MTFALRPMAAQDLDAVAHLAAVVSEAPQWNRAAYIDLLQSSTRSYFAWLAVDLLLIGGFAVASWLAAEESAELETVVVDPRFRRQGLGSVLVQACLLSASQAGARVMRLEVRESNAAAHALYRSNGFSPAGRRRAYYSAPVEDAILFEAPLGSSGLQSPL